MLTMFIENKLLFLIIFFQHNVSCTFFQSVRNAQESFISWSPDSVKELWCPEYCFDNPPEPETTEECCACEAFPPWQRLDLFPNMKYVSLALEMKNAVGTRSNLFTLNYTDTNDSMYGFSHRYGILRRFPMNVCDYRLVFIDLTGNSLTDIGNVSCLVYLDTLIMSKNKIKCVSNDTFNTLSNLRNLDLSENIIKSLDNNLFRNIHVLNINLGNNELNQLDVSNILSQNRVGCITSFENNKYSIDITNEINLQVGTNISISCNTISFSNTATSENPLLSVSKHIYMTDIVKYVPCGQYFFGGSAYNCDCELGQFLTVSLDTLKRLYYKPENGSYCSAPKRLVNITIDTVWLNETLRDYMICDLIDNCTKISGCHCQCTSQPSKSRLIVDCSNQQCRDLPDVIPNVRYGYEVVLNMSNNSVSNIQHKEYFNVLGIVDLSRNPVSQLNDDIGEMSKLSKFIVTKHQLQYLPVSIKKLNPRVFIFGQNGLPCECDNKWIGEWIRNFHASRILLCSNFNNKTFDEMYNNIEDCPDDNDNYGIVVAFICVSVLIAVLPVLAFFRYELTILRRLILNRSTSDHIWENDIYISFDESNEHVRKFIRRDFIPYLEDKNHYKLFTHIRDSISGENIESSVLFNMEKSRTVIILHSEHMYDVDQSAVIPRTIIGNDKLRLEYNIAWKLFSTGKVKQILIINFDNSVHVFNYRKTKALFRLGIGMYIFSRKIHFKNEILHRIGKPINATRRAW